MKRSFKKHRWFQGGGYRTISLREMKRVSERAGGVSKGGTEVESNTLFYLHAKCRCPIFKMYMSVRTRNKFCEFR